MTNLSGPAREAFWQDLVAHFERRARPYCRRLRCSESEIDEILWDLWQEATEQEQALVASSDQWPLLRNLLRQLCRTRLRSWRRESCPYDKDVDVAQPDSDEPLEELQIHDWLSQSLADLSAKQRLAVDFRYRWGWPYWAVAAAIDTAEPTARVHVVRGIRRLRELAKQSPKRSR